MVHILTKENKKQDILYHIEKKSHGDDPFELSEKSLIEDLTDESYDEKSVKNLIKELINEGSICKNSLDIEIFYPKEFKKDVFKKWKGLVLPYDNMFILFLIYIMMNIIIYYLRRELFEASLIIPFLLWFGFKVFRFTFNFTEKNIPYFKKINFKYFFINLVSMSITMIITYIISEYIIQDEFSTSLLITALGVGIAIGNLFYFATKKQNSKN